MDGSTTYQTNTKRSKYELMHQLLTNKRFLEYLHEQLSEDFLTLGELFHLVGRRLELTARERCLAESKALVQSVVALRIVDLVLADGRITLPRAQSSVVTPDQIQSVLNDCDAWALDREEGAVEYALKFAPSGEAKLQAMLDS